MTCLTSAWTQNTERLVQSKDLTTALENCSEWIDEESFVRFTLTEAEKILQIMALDRYDRVGAQILEEVVDDV